MATQLLLINDVEHLGRKGDVVSVKSGYAYNFLIPKGFGLVADSFTLRKQTKLQEERRKLAEQDRKEAEGLSSSLQGATLSTEVKVDHDGHMYGSVSALDIVHLLKLHTGIDIEKRFVQLKHAIKQIGDYDITLRLKEGVSATIHLKIIPEQVEHLA